MTAPTPLDILDAVAQYGAPEIQLLVDGLCPCLALVPIASLLKLADAVAHEIAAKNEIAALKAGAQAADAAADAAEAAALAARGAVPPPK